MNAAGHKQRIHYRPSFIAALKRVRPASRLRLCLLVARRRLLL